MTQILCALEPCDLQQVLLLMAQRVPRTLQGLLLHALSPAAAEVLTQKLEMASASAGRLVIAILQPFPPLSAFNLATLLSALTFHLPSVTLQSSTKPCCCWSPHPQTAGGLH